MTVQNQTNVVNGIDLATIQETMQAIQADPDLARCKFRASNQWIGGTHNRTAIDNFFAAKQEMSHKHPFHVEADEPPMLAGGDDAANPVEHLLNALASCITTSIVAHAAARGIKIEQLESRLEGDIDLRGFFGLSPAVPKGFSSIRVNFHAKTDPENLEKLKQLADFSPVLNTITKGAKIDVQVTGV